MKIYIVCYEYSNYDAHSFRNIKAFMDETAAELFMLEYKEENQKKIDFNIEIEKKRQQLFKNGKYIDKKTGKVTPEYDQISRSRIWEIDDIERGDYHIEEIELE